MKRKILLLLILGSLLLSSCAELILVGAGAAVGGAVGYYVGKEGYKVKIEKEER